RRYDGPGGDDDDAAVPRPDHRRDDGLRRAEDAGQVEIEHALPRLEVGLDERAPGEPADPGHEDVDPAARGHDPFGEGRHGLDVDHMDGWGDESLAVGSGDPLGEPRALVLDGIGDRDDRPVDEEPQDHGLAQRSGAAGDDGDAPGHCSGDLEAGFDRGWPEIDASRLRTAMFIARRPRRPAWSSLLADPGAVARSFSGRGHDRGALDLVVTDLADVELLEVLAELLEGLLERGEGLPRARERRRAGQEVVLHVGVVDPALLDLRNGDP